jgi:hypothetical protein
LKYEISGSWLDEIYLKNLLTGEEEFTWADPPINPNAHMNYYFSNLTLALNIIKDEMRGVISPTDCRWRKDIEYWEQGLED